MNKPLGKWAVLAMVSATQFAGWRWLALALSTPVVFWGGWRFHRAALQNARHLAATMDTLISLGTTAAVTAIAFLWALKFGIVGGLLLTVLLGLVICARSP